MANWTVATTLERLGQILEEENMITDQILDMGDLELSEINLKEIVETMKDRIVRDQFTPKAKAQHRKKQEAKPDAT